MPKRSKFQTLLLYVVLTVGLIPLGYFLVLESGSVKAKQQDSTDVVSSDETFDRYVENIAFGVGEKLTFDINYGFINAGTAVMEIQKLIEFEDRPCYHVVTRTNSNSFFSSVYKVDDRIESIIDAAGIFSWHFEKHLREGSYRSDRVYTFDQRNHSVVYEKDTLEIAPFVQDAISVMYYIRTQDLKVGQSVFINNFVDGKKYELEVRVIKKESIDVEAGTFDCLVVEPLMKSVGVFKHEGKLTVWLTDDRLKMPVLMKSKVLVGSISAELTDFELGEIEEF